MDNSASDCSMRFSDSAADAGLLTRVSTASPFIRRLSIALITLQRHRTLVAALCANWWRGSCLVRCRVASGQYTVARRRHFRLARARSTFAHCSVHSPERSFAVARVLAVLRDALSDKSPLSRASLHFCGVARLSFDSRPAASPNHLTS